jgi:hypothetical protein
MTKEELSKRDIIYLIALLESNKDELRPKVEEENPFIDDINEINKIDEILIKLNKLYTQ